MRTPTLLEKNGLIISASFYVVPRRVLRIFSRVPAGA